MLGPHLPYLLNLPQTAAQAVAIVAICGETQIAGNVNGRTAVVLDLLGACAVADDVAGLTRVSLDIAGTTTIPSC